MSFFIEGDNYAKFITCRLLYDYDNSHKLINFFAANLLNYTKAPSKIFGA